MMICVVKPVFAGVQPRFVAAASGITGAIGSVGGSAGACATGPIPGAVRGPRGMIGRPTGFVGAVSEAAGANPGSVRGPFGTVGRPIGSVGRSGATGASALGLV